MMKLSTMSDIVYACSNQNENLLTGSFIKLWFSNHGPVEFVRISANCVFRFEAEGNTFFLRFNSDRERNVEQLEEEIRFVDYLAKNGVYVSEPMPSLNGLCVRSIESAVGLLHASVFKALPGQICHEIGELTPEMLTAWGYALGNLHHKSQNYTNCVRRHSWQEHLKLIEVYLPREEYTAWRQLEQVKQKLSYLPTDDGVFGLIHYDFELDNIIWDNNIPGIIDFDDCALYWYVADIAFTLRDLFDDRADRVNINVEAYQLFIQGYQAARDINLDDLKLIPVFLRMHNLTVFAKIMRTLEGGRNPIEPAWMDRLRTKLLNKFQFYREAFGAYTDLE